MNAAHLHLLVNHVPIFASLFALPFALYGLRATATTHFLRSAAFLLLISGIATGVAMRTGEAASDVVEGLAHVQTLDISAHEEDAARTAPFVLGAAAVGVLVSFVDARSQGRLRRRWTLVLLTAAALSSALLILTGLSGGKINHQELREGFDPDAPVPPDDPLDL